jgi:hypothetical protein
VAFLNAVFVCGRGLSLAKMTGVSAARGTTCHYYHRRVSGVWLIAGFLVLLAAAACQRSAPVLGGGLKPVAVPGTITGTIRVPEGTAPVSGRTVEIVNVATGERRSTTTSSNGGFTTQLPAGKYRLDLALRDGETLVARPDVINLDAGDADSHVEFVIGATRVVRPRGPGYRVDNGLGSPSA